MRKKIRLIICLKSLRIAERIYITCFLDIIPLKKILLSRLKMIRYSGKLLNEIYGIISYLAFLEPKMSGINGMKNIANPI